MKYTLTVVRELLTADPIDLEAFNALADVGAAPGAIVYIDGDKSATLTFQCDGALNGDLGASLARHGLQGEWVAAG